MPVSLETLALLALGTNGRRSIWVVLARDIYACDGYGLLYYVVWAGDAYAVRQDSKCPEGLDLVVVLSTGCEEVLKVDHVKHEPCCNELFAACKDDQIILVSPSILYGLLRRKRDGQDNISECLDSITRHYAAYLNRDEDFVLLIPTHNPKSLKGSWI